MTLDILLTEIDDNQLVRQRFAKLSRKGFNPSTLSVAALFDWGDYHNQINERYTPSALAELYLEVVQRVHLYFQEVVGHKWSPQNLLQQILRTNFTYASPAAYQQIQPVIPKEKENDQKVIPVAHYNDQCEIIVSLPEHTTLETVKMYSFHEFGHHMHNLDQPENYKDSDATMKETRAILVEKEEGMEDSFRLNTPHGRANELLRKAEETKFRGITFAEEWYLLTRFLKHEDFKDYLDGKLRLY